SVRTAAAPPRFPRPGALSRPRRIVLGFTREEAMRTRMILISGLAAVALAACGQDGGETSADGSPKAAKGAPNVASLEEGPKPGLWRITTSVGGMTMPAVETCVRE